MLEQLDHRGVEGSEGQLVPYGVRSIDPDKPKRNPPWLAGLLGALVTVTVLAAAVTALSHILAEVSVASVVAALQGINPGVILASMVLVALGYLSLTGYDWIGLAHLRRRLPYAKVALGSFLSYAFANNLGFALLTGGSVRYRIYSSEGVTAGEVAILTGLCGLTYSLSAVLMIGLCLVSEPDVMAGVMHLPQTLASILGTLLLLALAVYVVWVGTARRAVVWSAMRFVLPGARSTLAQLGIGMMDMCFAAGALYMLLPGDPGVGFLVFASMFAVAMVIGIVSHVPGGLGVFETVMLLAVPGLSKDQILASLLVYRCVYYLIPFLTAIALLVWYEAKRMPLLNPGSRRVAAAVRLGRRWLRPIVGRARARARQLLLRLRSDAGIEETRARSIR